MKVGMVTLGCAKNTVDTEIILGELKKRGFSLTSHPDEAEVLVINTCGFIEAAKQESIDTILELAQWKEKGECRALIVTGCLTQRYGEEILDNMPEVDAVLGTGTFHRLPEALERVLADERVLFVDSPTFDYDQDVVRLRVTPKHSAYVKIAEGCDNCCSYCAIPLIRGGFHSRRKESIIKEVTALAAEGVQEINLIAQDTTRYGKDLYGRFELANLLRELLKVPGPAWYRLLYCYPTHFTDELIELMATESRLVDYLDLPLQHASPKILRAMHRPSEIGQVKDLLKLLRMRIPHITLRTSFIVGFPGESEEDVELLAGFMREVEFDHVGVFTYSQEEDTAAALLPNQVDEQTKQERRDYLMSIQQPISRKRNERFVGRIVEVLVEDSWAEGSGVIGRSRKDAPEVDGVVFVKDCKATAGQIVQVEVTDARDYDLVGVER